MKEERPRAARMRACAFAMAKVAAGTIAFVAVALLWSWAASPPIPAQGHGGPAQAQPGWGHEAVADLRESMRAASPIAEANACGAGASTCFKCHDGKRAALPAAKKWHTDHKSVDNSCVGCHKGNARLIKKELAHAELVKDPRPQAKQICASCHKPGSGADVAKAY